MGMPIIPESATQIQLKDALSLVIASVGEEELGLAHIINAEGEKIQAAVAAYNAGKISLQDLLKVNDDVKDMLKVVGKSNMTLVSKLETVLDLMKLDIE